MDPSAALRRRVLLVDGTGVSISSECASNPSRIAHVAIRSVTAPSSDDARFSAVFEGIEPKRWTLFTDPAALAWPE